jgi:hypothetical protein
MAYDASHSRIVLFGGQDPSAAPLGDTWTWDGMTWTQQTPPSSPSQRYHTGLAYHPASGGLLLFGGTTATDIPSDTWAWNGSTWTQQSPSNTPSTNPQGMAYDGLLKLVVMLGRDGPDVDVGRYLILQL